MTLFVLITKIKTVVMTTINTLVTLIILIAGIIIFNIQY